MTKTSLMPKSLGSNGINFESLIAKIVDLSYLNEAFYLQFYYKK